MLRDMCRAFADSELAPNAGKWDQAHEFPVNAIKQMGEMGLMGVAQPTEYNGAGSVCICVYVLLMPFNVSVLTIKCAGWTHCHMQLGARKYPAGAPALA